MSRNFTSSKLLLLNNRPSRHLASALIDICTRIIRPRRLMGFVLSNNRERRYPCMSCLAQRHGSPTCSTSNPLPTTFVLTRPWAAFVTRAPCAAIEQVPYPGAYFTFGRCGTGSQEAFTEIDSVFGDSQYHFCSTGFQFNSRMSVSHPRGSCASVFDAALHSSNSHWTRPAVRS